MKDSGIYYSLGALLYIAADNTNIIDDIIFEKFNIPFSLAFSFDMEKSGKINPVMRSKRLPNFL